MSLASEEVSPVLLACENGWHILAWLASGVTTDEIIADFPELTKDDIQASLAFAVDKENKLHNAYLLDNARPL